MSFDQNPSSVMVRLSLLAMLRRVWCLVRVTSKVDFFPVFVEANHKLMFAESKLSKTGDLNLRKSQLSIYHNLSIKILLLNDLICHHYQYTEEGLELPLNYLQLHFDFYSSLISPSLIIYIETFTLSGIYIMHTCSTVQ